ncbi:hypothetical protein D018_1345A, partial [Vibrio parahaemolyticus VP2007-007]
MDLSFSTLVSIHPLS